MPDPPGGGSAEEIDVEPAFRERMLSIISRDAVEPLRVLADGGNGMAGPMVGPVLEQLPVEVVTT